MTGEYLGIIIMYFALIASVVLFYFANSFSKKIKEIVSKNNKEAIPFGRSIASGMISGVIVVALDKVITQWSNNPPTLDFSSFYNFLLSITGVIIVGMLVGAFLLFIVFSLIYKGLKSVSK